MDIINQETTVVPIDRLRPHPENPNRGDLGAIYQSIKENGFWGHVLAQKGTDTIIAGAHRWKAAKEAGAAEIPVTYLDVDDDRARRILLADNRTQRLGSDDPQALATLLQDLATTPAGLAGSGYDGDALDELLADLGQMQPEMAGDPDAVPEVPDDQEPLTRRGDIIRLGRHTLGCIDSTNVDEVRRLLGGVTPDMVWTDPPYGIDLDTDYAQRSQDVVHGRSYPRVLGDDRAFDPRPWLSAFAAVDEQFWWGGDHYYHHLPAGGSWLVWDKRTEASDAQRGSQFEACWSRQPHRRAIMRHLWIGFTARERDEPRSHPTQKPVALAEWCFAQYGTEGDVVLDLFGGSGTCLVAAERTGRTCYMAELSEHYCDCIVQRWQNLTGRTAVREPATDSASAEASDHARVLSRA